MDEDKVQSAMSLPDIDNILSDSSLHDSARAFFLLRVCQFLENFRPDAFDYYWDHLLKVQEKLPSESRKEFETLRVAAKPPKAKHYKGPIRKIIDMANSSVMEDGIAISDASTILSECEDRLRKRWWPFGKQPAWVAIVKAWAKIDRNAALVLIGKVPQEVQQSVLERLYNRSPLSIEEWDLARKHANIVTHTIVEMLDREKPALNLSPELAISVGSRLLSQIQSNAESSEQEHIIEKKQEQHLLRYIKLVGCMVEQSTDVACDLMESLFTFAETSAASRFSEKWPERFMILREIINYWVSFLPIRDKALNFLLDKNKNSLRDFALSQYHGMIVASEEEATGALKFLKNECKDKVSSETWLLVTLVRRGMGKIAVALAKSSKRLEDLLPIVYRAWLFIDSDAAYTYIKADDLRNDPIGKLMHLRSIKEQIEFLRKKTDNGRRCLPRQLWSRPDVYKILSQLLIKKNDALKDNSLMLLYDKNEPDSRQFKEYVKMHGFGQYGREYIDPSLLMILVAWTVKYPEEVDSLLVELWDVMEPDVDILTNDIFRNNIFERCQTLFAASPKYLDKLFVRWVKDRLVDNTVSQRIGNTIRTLSLQPTAPFLYCYLSAKKVANISSERCDEILKIALSTYKANEDFIMTAAGLFASDKGLNAINPPVDLNDASHLKAWQLGVVDASAKQILSMVIGVEQEKS